MTVRMILKWEVRATTRAQVKQADAATLSGDTDDEGSGWETASDVEEDPSADGVQAAAMTDAEDGAGKGFTRATVAVTQ